MKIMHVKDEEQAVRLAKRNTWKRKRSKGIVLSFEREGVPYSLKIDRKNTTVVGELELAFPSIQTLIYERNRWAIFKKALEQHLAEKAKS